MQLFFALPIALLLACTTPQEKEISYDSLKTSISEMRQNIHEAFVIADSLHRDSLVSYSKTYLLNEIGKDIFPRWYGTTWDYNGITQTPGKGKIACGYFVTTVIRDAGFDIPRSEYGQLPSETLICKFTDTPKRFHNSPLDKFISYMKKQNNGIYIVGLDTHVGFIYKNGDELRFVHSNYYSPNEKVMSQELKSNSPLADSHYRIVGALLNDEAIIKWILNEKI